MSSRKNELQSLLKDLSLFDDIKTSDIPDLDLYMEQLTTFMDEKLRHLKKDKNDKILTKTMINNYTKAGILMPPKNKKYSKDHVILLIIIYYLKQILSINDIHSLLSPILKDMETTEDDIISLDNIYSTFLEIKSEELNNFIDNLGKKYSIISNKSRDIDTQHKDLSELFLMVIMLIAQADAQKRLAEKIIDTYFK